MAQLDDNVKALEVTLTQPERARLDALTQPTFGFPQNMEPMFPSIHFGGATVNGISAPLSPFVIGAEDTPIEPHDGSYLPSQGAMRFSHRPFGCQS